MKFILYILSILIATTAFSQAELKRADRLYNNNSFIKAVKVYESYINEANKVELETYLKAAEANYNVNNMRQAATYYEKAYSLSNTLEKQHVSRYTRCLRSVREYDRANTIWLSYLDSQGDKEAIVSYKKELEKFEVILNDETPSRYTLINLNSNTEYSDFGTASFNDKIVFSSSRPGAAKELYAWNEQPYLSLFVADTTSSGDLKNPSLLSRQINTEFHDATIAFSKINNTVYFASSNINKNRLVLDYSRNNNFKLYKGVIKDGKIINKEAIHFNSDEYSIGHPHVSDDGKLLFFVSDMPGGYGEADIYYAKIYEDGMISNPINAGPLVNTHGNDFFPFTIENAFYFASDGHAGFGGLDIYEGIFNSKDGFSEIKNIGKTANTAYDDFAIYFNEDHETGYVSSNRPNGKGDDDIYYFKREPLPCDQFITGTVIDKQSRQVLFNTKITLKDLDNNLLFSLVTNEQGAYSTEIPCETRVVISAEKEKYISATKEAETFDIDGDYTAPTDFELNKIEDIIVVDEGVEKIKLDPIFFEYDKSEVTPQAAMVLDKAVSVLNDIPDMVIKIEAHTDSRGSDEYNYELSNKRAKATQEYLYSQGVDKRRVVSARGFGERMLLNKCKNGIKCSDEEHFKNRRSNFIIVKR
ncbi:OmpA family protein [Patiriisocius hiemis]|uniref:OmpA family protein n=1 Tax=Patiriisocius hiemis TaxID=3075604 RepID=A0ABU2YAI1_9FLAO|nr:OmpA family protein [Constantimarinum sp. W242]MDT0554861.1 OmpA family protein [Constantimarinum sp. W242]